MAGQPPGASRYSLTNNAKEAMNDTQTKNADAPGRPAPAGSAAPRTDPWAKLFERTLQRVLDDEPTPPVEWHDLWEAEPKRAEIARDWELTLIGRTLAVEAEESGVGLVASRELDQIIGQFERGMDGYASRMSRDGRDHYAGLLRRLREVRASFDA